MNFQIHITKLTATTEGKVVQNVRAASSRPPSTSTWTCRCRRSGRSGRSGANRH